MVVAVEVLEAVVVVVTPTLLVPAKCITMAIKRDNSKDPSQVKGHLINSSLSKGASPSSS